ncbi:MAG: adenylate kinase family protein [Fimbriiglobus sp.]
MRVVLVGPPGSGKGTMAKRLVDRFGLAYLGTGEILRDAMRRRSPLGVQIEPLMRAGRFAPDDVVNGLIAELFAATDGPTWFVMDGYPRSASQATFLDGLLAGRSLPLSAVAHLGVHDATILQRIAGRLGCPTSGCGAIFHPAADPPRTPGICDRCGAGLYARDDDGELLVRARLAAYRANADELLAYYRRTGLLRDVDASGPANDVFEELAALITTGERPV